MIRVYRFIQVEQIIRGVLEDEMKFAEKLETINQIRKVQRQDRFEQEMTGLFPSLEIQ